MMDRQQTAELYEQILRHCGAAESALRALSRRARQQEIAQDMAELRRQYRQIALEAEGGLQITQGRPTPVKRRLYQNSLQMHCKTILDHSPANLARLVIRGFQAGEHRFGDYRRVYINAEDEAAALCARLLEMQRMQKLRFRRYLN